MNGSSLAFFENCAYREFTGKKNPEIVVIFFHGFPGDSGKNEDVAEQLCELLGCSTYVFEYSGLGNSTGYFSLQNSIIDSELFLKSLIKSKVIKRLVVVGHSWGGLVAINLMSKIREISEAILLAPFVLLPNEILAREILVDFISYEKTVRNKEYDIEKLMSDYDFVHKNFDPLRIANSISEPKIKTTIVQGEEDNVCPPTGALELKNKIGSSAHLINISAGHWFENREQLFEIIKSCLEK